MRTVDLRQLVAQHFGAPKRSQRSFMGLPSAGRVYDVVQNETRTEPIIANLFWQVFAASPAYARALFQAGASQLALTQSEMIVVNHEEQFHLVVFDPAYDSYEPQGVEIHPTEEELRIGWEKWRRTRFSLLYSGAPAFRSRASQALKLVESVDASLVIEAVQSKPFGLLVARPPRVQRTAIPTPCWGVSPTVGGTANATAGAFVREKDSPHREGVTVALHALTDTLAAVVPGSTQIEVNGWTGTVISTDAITDSAFVELPAASAPSSSRGARGPLSGVSPRLNEAVSFEGITTGHQAATITGWSPDLPFILPYSQVKVFTTADTAPGDSGAALVDGDDCILGFSFYRTGLGEPIEFSAWIWADSVYGAHNVQ